MPKKKGYYLVPGVLDFDPKLLRKPEAENPDKFPEKSGAEPMSEETGTKKRFLWEAEG